jgi:CRISPR-associated protein Cas2
MIVISLTDCPPALRGDLTKWLQEISTGVYVGQVNARVRDEIWRRVQENCKSGRATLVYSTNNEQRMDFRVHNTGWYPIDFDGLKLMLRPNPSFVGEIAEPLTGFSKAARMHQAKKASKRKRAGKPLPTRYVVLDVETTGLSSSRHEIIEICALIVGEKDIKAKFHALVKATASIPASICALTGITDDTLVREGRLLTEVLPEFLQFVDGLPIVSHNGSFDYEFLRAACERCGLPLFANPCVDTLVLARRLVKNVANYKLATLVQHFGIETTGSHRSEADCLATKLLYEKLIELRNA